MSDELSLSQTVNSNKPLFTVLFAVSFFTTRSCLGFGLNCCLFGFSPCAVYFSLCSRCPSPCRFGNSLVRF